MLTSEHPPWLQLRAQRTLPAVGNGPLSDDVFLSMLSLPVSACIEGHRHCWKAGSEGLGGRIARR